jgi:hypothetical protein
MAAAVVNAGRLDLPATRRTAKDAETAYSHTTT